MVSCEALREGLQVGQYYMFDAAIPSEAIDETLRAETRDDEAFAKYVPSAWHDYTNACGGDGDGSGRLRDEQSRV